MESHSAFHSLFPETVERNSPYREESWGEEFGKRSVESGCDFDVD